MTAPPGYAPRHPPRPAPPLSAAPPHRGQRRHGPLGPPPGEHPCPHPVDVDHRQIPQPPHRQRVRHARSGHGQLVARPDSPRERRSRTTSHPAAARPRAAHRSGSRPPSRRSRWSNQPHQNSARISGPSGRCRRSAANASRAGAEVRRGENPGQGPAGQHVVLGAVGGEQRDGDALGAQQGGQFGEMSRVGAVTAVRVLDLHQDHRAAAVGLPGHDLGRQPAEPVALPDPRPGRVPDSRPGSSPDPRPGSLRRGRPRRAPGAPPAPPGRRRPPGPPRPPGPSRPP